MTQTCCISTPNTIDSGLRLELMPESSRTEVMRIWQQLEVDLQSRRLICSSIWVDTWLNHFGRRIPHQFAVAYRNEMPCGICLMTRGVAERNGPVPMRTWHIGTAGEPDADSACIEYNALLVRPADRGDFQQALWNWIAARSDWDEFRLDGLCEEELAGWRTTNPNWSIASRTTSYFDLAAARNSNTGTIDCLGSKTRSVIRQNLRWAGPIKSQWAETIGEAEEIFAELVALHQARWNSVGLPGSYSSRVFHEFHLELLHRLVPLGLMGLCRVSNEQGTIGCTQALIDNNRACMYQLGRVLTSGHRTSPGVILDFLTLEECRQRGLDAVDFLAGDSSHKRRLSTNNSALFWAFLRRPSFKHRLVDGLRSVKRAFQRTFRNPIAAIPRY